MHYGATIRYGPSQLSPRANWAAVDAAMFQVPNGSGLIMLDRLRAWFRKHFIDPRRPSDPPIGVRQPRGRGPGGRSPAVAVMEPDDDRGTVDAVSRQPR